MSILNFKEISTSATSSPSGEDFEALVRQLGNRLKLSPEWTGRGSDGGRDLYFTETRTGVLQSENIRWLVSCKDFSVGGKSVKEADVGTIIEKLKQHKADGFLLATTTTASTSLKAMLDGIQSDGEYRTSVWDRHELENLLLREENVDLVKAYMPNSYALYRRLNSLPLALDALELLVPETIYRRIIDVINRFNVDGVWLSGEKIWPADRKIADVIDAAFIALFEEHDVSKAAGLLVHQDVEIDAFNAAVKTLISLRAEQAKDLLRAIVETGDHRGRSMLAYSYLVAEYEIEDDDRINLACKLADEDLKDLFEGEIEEYTYNHLAVDILNFKAWDDLDALSSRTELEEVLAYDIVIRANQDRRQLEFAAPVRMAVQLTYDGSRASSSPTFPGSITGFIDSQGVTITDVTVDTSQF